MDAVLAVGGSGGSSIAARAVRDLPIGLPKLIVSTTASGDVAPYVGAKDVTMTYGVVDIAGINRVSRPILGNAAAAAAGMAKAHEAAPAPSAEERPLVGASMFGVTTPAVDAARERGWTSWATRCSCSTRAGREGVRLRGSWRVGCWQVCWI